MALTRPNEHISTSRQYRPTQHRSGAIAPGQDEYKVPTSAIASEGPDDRWLLFGRPEHCFRQAAWTLAPPGPWSGP
jgi:hypothetical protein